MRTLRKLLIALVGTVSVFTLGACGGSGGTDAASGPVTLTWWHNGTADPLKTLWQQVADDYHKAHPDVSFLVEDTIEESAGAAGVRFLEIRGRAVPAVVPARNGLSDRIIRIHPSRVVGWNVDPDRPGSYARDIATKPE